MPVLPPVRDDALNGLSHAEAVELISAKFRETATKAASDILATGATLRKQNEPARREVVQNSADHFVERIWNGVVSAISKNPTAAIKAVMVIGSAIASVVATGGAALPSAIAAVGAVVGPMVTATLSEAGLDLRGFLAQGIESLLGAWGVDNSSAWKIAGVASSVVMLGVNIGVAVVVGGPAALDTQLVGDLVTSIGTALNMKLSSVETLSDTLAGFASLGMLIGGSIASGANVRDYAGLGDIFAKGKNTFSMIIEGIGNGTLEPAAIAKEGTTLVPLIQAFLEKAYTDLESHGGLITGLQDSYLAIVDYIQQQTALHGEAVQMRRGLV